MNEEQQETQAPAEPQKKKRRWPWILLGVVVVLIILGSLGPAQRVYTEDALNARFLSMVAQNQTVNHLNPLETTSLDVQEGVAYLTMTWEDGQSLTADVTVDESGALFDVSNVQIPDAGYFEAAFEGAAEEIIESVLEEFLKAHARDVVRVELAADQVTVHFE